MVVYSIKDLEKLSGVKAHTLRIWEKRYNIFKPHRTPTNIRYYLDEDLRLILNIAFLNRRGIKISKIAKMEKGQIQRKVAELTEVDESFEGQLDSMTISLLELDEEKFNKLLNKRIEQEGFIHTMMEVVYPLLDKLAMMWITGSIKSIHEKFVSSLIKRKCIAEIDKLESNKEVCFLIYLPKGETNELSLLFLHYILKKNGMKVINAGINMALEELKEADALRPIHYVFTIINESMTQQKITPYVKALCKNFPSSKIVLSGIQIANINFEAIDKRIVTVASSSETIEFVQGIQD